MKRIFLEAISLSNKYILRAALIIFAVLAFLTVTGAGNTFGAQELCYSVFGGVRCGKSYSDTSRAAVWLLTQIPLLGMLGIYIGGEFSGHIYLSIIRSESAKKWWSSKLLSTVIFSAGYAVCSFVIVFFVGLLFGNQQEIITDFGELFAAFCMYALGCVFLCVCTLFLSVIWCDVKKSLVTVVVLLVLNIELGWFFPQTNHYLLFTFSMIKRTNLIDEQYGNNVYISAGVILLMCISFFLIGLKASENFIVKLQKNDFGGR